MHVGTDTTPHLPRVAARASLLGTDTAFDLLAQVQRLRSEGRHVISFGIGEPDICTPEHVKQAAKRALDADMTRYGPSNGSAELRAAIAQEVAETRGIPVNEDQVVVAPGAKPLIFYTLSTLIDAGEEVLYPNPGFPTYESIIRWLGAIPVAMPLSEATHFQLDRQALCDAVTERTKLIILNSPNNPTGGVLDLADLELVAEVAQKHNCWVLSDEIYSRLMLDGTFRSIAALAGMAERTIIMDGFSKTYAMTGWRLGYGVMSRQLAELMARVEINVESCTCTFTQAAGVEALIGPQASVEAFTSELRARAQLVVDLLNQIEGVRCLPPRGAFYAFPNVTDACRRLGCNNAEELAHRLLHEAGVAVLPRSCFGTRNPGETEEYVRLSFATGTDQIREGIARIDRFLASASA